MFTTILAQSSASKFHEYALTVINKEEDDIRTLIAVFPSHPSNNDWKNWLSGWSSCGYVLYHDPVLIRTI